MFYNASSVFLECNAATRVLCGVEISILVLEERNGDLIKLYVIGTDQSGLKSFTQNKGRNNYC
jgi:hypothetical protein